MSTIKTIIELHQRKQTLLLAATSLIVNFHVVTHSLLYINIQVVDKIVLNIIETQLIEIPIHYSSFAEISIRYENKSILPTHAAEEYRKLGYFFKKIYSTISDYFANLPNDSIYFPVKDDRLFLSRVNDFCN